MVGTHDRQHLRAEALAGEHAVALVGMPAHDRHLVRVEAARLVEDRRGDVDLADVVQQRRLGEAVGFEVAEAEAAGEGGGEPGHEEAVLVGGVVEALHRPDPVADAGLAHRAADEVGPGIDGGLGDRPLVDEEAAVEAPRRVAGAHGAERHGPGLVGEGADGVAQAGNVERRAEGPGSPERDPEQARTRAVLVHQDDEGRAPAGAADEAAHPRDRLRAEIVDVGDEGVGRPGRGLVAVEVVDLAIDPAGEVPREILGEAAAAAGVVRDQQDPVHRGARPPSQENIASTASRGTVACPRCSSAIARRVVTIAFGPAGR